MFVAGAMLAVSGLSAQNILTMDRALDIATDNSPDLRRSYMSMLRSQENLNAQEASLKSRFALDLNPVAYTKTRSFDTFFSQWYTNENFHTQGTFRIDQPILFTDGTISLVNTFGWQDNKTERSSGSFHDRAFQNNFYVRLMQPLFTYNTTKMALKEIELDYENSIISYSLQRLSTERQITNQFYAVYMAQQRLDISRGELSNSEKNFEVIQNRVEVDLAPKSELFQAELNLANARSAVEDRKVSLENAKDVLKQTLGMPIDDDIMASAVIAVEPVNVDIKQAVDYAMNSRLELRQREIATERLDFQMVRTRATNEFSGALDLSMGIIGDDPDLANIFHNQTRNPRVSLTFSVPIFDWGARRARIRAQERAQDINQLDIVELKKQIEIDIRQVFRNMANLLIQIDIAKQSERNAQLTYDLNTIKYRNGDISGMEMNQFETQLSTSKINYAQTLINYKIELLNLRILTLYDFENGVSIVPKSSTRKTKR